MVLLALPPTMDTPLQRCLCGRKTVEAHDFLFCSTKCARADSLRSLDNPECHYRSAVRDAYVQAGAPELQPRRMKSTVHLRPGASASGQHTFAMPPPFPIPTRSPHRPYMRDQNIAAFPPNPSLQGYVFPGNAEVANPVVASRHALPGRTANAQPSASIAHRAFEPISLDAIPFPEYVPTRPLRRVPTSIDGRNNHKKSLLASLLSFGRSRKGKEVENPGWVFGQPVNPMDPPVRNDPRRMGRGL